MDVSTRMKNINTHSMMDNGSHFGGRSRSDILNASALTGYGRDNRAGTLQNFNNYLNLRNTDNMGAQKEERDTSPRFNQRLMSVPQRPSGMLKSDDLPHFNNSGDLAAPLNDSPRESESVNLNQNELTKSGKSNKSKGSSKRITLQY